MVAGIGGGEGREDIEGREPFDEAPAEAQPLPLGEEERLPWLESADDVDYDDDDGAGGRMAGFIILGVLSLAVLIGGLYWFTHRGSAMQGGDGSLIEASKEPYKVAPENPGGKTFEGTGDSSFKVSEGEKPQAKVADAAAASKAAPAAPTSTPATETAPAKASAPAPGGDSGGVGVQVAAYSSRSAAEAGWSKLSSQYDALKGVNHRIVEGKADIGTVYRLQAVAGDTGAANALCGKLKAAGLACQVK